MMNITCFSVRVKTYLLVGLLTLGVGVANVKAAPVAEDSTKRYKVELDRGFIPRFLNIFRLDFGVIGSLVVKKDHLHFEPKTKREKRRNRYEKKIDYNSIRSVEPTGVFFFYNPWFIPIKVTITLDNDEKIRFSMLKKRKQFVKALQEKIESQANG